MLKNDRIVFRIIFQHCFNSTNIGVCGLFIFLRAASKPARSITSADARALDRFEFLGRASSLLQWNLYIVKIRIMRMPALVKQNLYTVKIATYKDSHGKKTEGKQSCPTAPTRRSKARRRENGGAANPRSRGIAVSSWRAPRRVAAECGKAAGA